MFSSQLNLGETQRVATETPLKKTMDINGVVSRVTRWNVTPTSRATGDTFRGDAKLPQTPIAFCVTKGAPAACCRVIRDAHRRNQGPPRDDHVYRPSLPGKTEVGSSRIAEPSKRRSDSGRYEVIAVPRSAPDRTRRLLFRCPRGSAKTGNCNIDDQEKGVSVNVNKSKGPKYTTRMDSHL